MLVTVEFGGYVVVQFYPWFKFSFLLFLGMVMYDNNMIMSLKQKKRKFEPRIKLNHNSYINIYRLRASSHERGSPGWPGYRDEFRLGFI